MMKKRLENKIAVITGGSCGIGAATAKLMIEEGANVIIADINHKQGEKLVQQIGHNISFFHMNVADENHWKKLEKFIEKKFNKLDIMFNNAGIIGFDKSLGPQDPENISLKTWHHIHNINLDGTFLGCKFAIKLMKKNKSGGAIINMSSRSGIVGVPFAAAYSSAKAAIRNYTKSVALYCAAKGYNIRCNSLHPGAILTPIWNPMLGNSDKDKKQNIKAISKGIPLGHMGEPIDVAYAVIYLASNEAKYITGAELNIDGGILAGSASAPNKKN